MSEERTINILILDDDLPILQLIQTVLEPHYRVHAFSEPKEALEALKAGLKIDLIISDISMPQISGFEVHDEVRASTSLRAVPFIYLTALDDREHYRKGMMQGADDYLTKPFTPQELLRAVEIRLERLGVLRDEGGEGIVMIQSMGGASILFGRTHIQWGAKKALEAFLYFLRVDGKVSTPEVKAALWQSSVPDNNLYVLYNRMRKAVGEFSKLESNAEAATLVVEREIVWDVAIFEKAAHRALEGRRYIDTESALTQYRGSFLPGFGSPWTELQRSKLEQLYMDLLELSVELAPNKPSQRSAQQRLAQFLGVEEGA